MSIFRDIYRVRNFVQNQGMYMELGDKYGREGIDEVK